MSDDFCFLAGDAGGRPGSDVGGDGVPHVLGFDELDRCLAGGVRQAVHHIEDCFAEGGGPRAWGYPYWYHR